MKKLNLILVIFIFNTSVSFSQYKTIDETIGYLNTEFKTAYHEYRYAFKLESNILKIYYKSINNEPPIHKFNIKKVKFYYNKERCGKLHFAIIDTDNEGTGYVCFICLDGSECILSYSKYKDREFYICQRFFDDDAKNMVKALNYLKELIKESKTTEDEPIKNKQNEIDIKIGQPKDVNRINIDTEFE